MRQRVAFALPLALAAMTALADATSAAAQHRSVRFMTVDPGHFHASLVHKEMYPQVSPQIDIYAPLGWDLSEHLTRLSAYNLRAERPTGWLAEIHTGPDFFERMLRERPGNVVVLSGRNSRKIEYVERSVGAGLHVLADKPWIVRAEDLPRLEAALARAAASGVVAYDIMTERYEITNELQRELVNDPAVFGRIATDTPEDPAVQMTSVHYILKTVSGAPLRRPTWFFDPRELGEALADVGTHLVDLSIWTLFPETALDYQRDAAVVSANRWPTALTRAQFSRVTGEPTFPAALAQWTSGDTLNCACNTRVVYALRGTHVKLDVLWGTEATHGDTHEAIYRGDRARVEVRQGEAERWRPEVYVVPNRPAQKAEVLAALNRRVAALQAKWPGVAVEDRGDRFLVVAPDRYRLGHEYHFSEVTARFLEYLAQPATMPAWERPNMLTKYFITTRGTDLSRATR
ncbi:MAG: oxidoreductase [Gemmatimonadetes bacterium]|nr:oxidoreductase [Gemmatimonadota bacterium]